MDFHEFDLGLYTMEIMVLVVLLQKVGRIQMIF